MPHMEPQTWGPVDVLDVETRSEGTVSLDDDILDPSEWVAAEQWARDWQSAERAGEDAPAMPECLETYLSHGGEVEGVSIRRAQYGARLSAPGYMDCTGSTYHATDADARESLASDCAEAADATD